MKCPQHPEIELIEHFTCPLCAQEARSRAYKLQRNPSQEKTDVTDMTKDELLELTAKISNVGSGLPVEHFLAALGLVVEHAFMQLDEDVRMHAVVEWISMLGAHVCTMSEQEPDEDDSIN